WSVASENGRAAGVLRPADGGEDPPRVEIGLAVDGPLAQRTLDQGDLVRGVGDGESPRPAEAVDVLAEHLGSEGVEGADGERLCALPHQPHHPFLHLAGGLVGEGDGEDGAGWDPAGEQPGDAVGDDPRLSAPCPGEHQEGAFGGGDGKTLRRVQSGEVHAGRTRIGWGTDRWLPPPRVLPSDSCPLPRSTPRPPRPVPRWRGSAAASSSTSSPRSAGRSPPTPATRGATPARTASGARTACSVASAWAATSAPTASGVTAAATAATAS